MTDAAAPLEPAPTRSRWPLRGLLTALFIFVVGPPLGALLMAGPLYFISGQHTVTDVGPGALQNELLTYLSVVYLMMLFSHFVGGVQAFLAAIWLGIRTFLRGSFGYGEAVLTSIVVSVIWTLRFGNMDAFLNLPRLLRGDFEGGGFPLTLIGLSVASAVICRWLLRVVRILPD